MVSFHYSLIAHYSAGVIWGKSPWRHREERRGAAAGVVSRKQNLSNRFQQLSPGEGLYQRSGKVGATGFGVQCQCASNAPCAERQQVGESVRGTACFGSRNHEAPFASKYNHVRIDGEP